MGGGGGGGGGGPYKQIAFIIFFNCNLLFKMSNNMKR